MAPIDSTFLRNGSLQDIPMSKDNKFWGGDAGLLLDGLDYRNPQLLALDQTTVKIRSPLREELLSAADSPSAPLVGSEMSPTCSQTCFDRKVTDPLGVYPQRTGMGPGDYTQQFETLSDSSTGDCWHDCLWSPDAPVGPRIFARSSSSTYRGCDGNVLHTSSATSEKNKTRVSGPRSVQTGKQGPRFKFGLNIRFEQMPARNEKRVATGKCISSSKGQLSSLDAAPSDRARAKIRERLSPIYKIPGPDRYVRGADQTVKNRRRVLQNRLSGQISRELARQKLIALEREANEIELRLQHLISEESWILQQTQRYGCPSSIRTIVKV
jgi:hypothetical protein